MVPCGLVWLQGSDLDRTSALELLRGADRAVQVTADRDELLLESAVGTLKLPPWSAVEPQDGVVTGGLARARNVVGGN